MPETPHQTKSNSMRTCSGTSAPLLASYVFMPLTTGGCSPTSNLRAAAAGHAQTLGSGREACSRTDCQPCRVRARVAVEVKGGSQVPKTQQRVKRERHL